MSSRNHSRGPEPSCAESDDSRVDFYANRQLREDYNWDRSRAFYANRVRFFLTEKDLATAVFVIDHLYRHPLPIDGITILVMTVSIVEVT